MVKIFFTKLARADLKDIKNYISIRSPLNAIRVSENILREIQTLAKHPEKGRIIIKTHKNIIRQIIIYKYRIFYRQVTKGIEILSVYHSARLIENNPGLQPYFEE